MLKWRVKCCHRAPTQFAHGWGTYLQAEEVRQPRELVVRLKGRPPRRRKLRKRRHHERAR